MVFKLNKLNRSNYVGLFLVFTGLIFIFTSIYFKSNIFSYIGLSFFYWGILFIVVLPGKYIKDQVVNQALISTLMTINDLILKGEYKGYPVYVPMPKEIILPHISDTKNEFIFIGDRNKPSLHNLYDSNVEGIRINPPGVYITDLIERELDIDFFNVTVAELEQCLKTSYIDLLDLVDKINIVFENDAIIIHYSGFKIDVLSQFNIINSVIMKIGDPIMSSLACIITRVYKKPIFIDDVEIGSSGVKISYMFYTGKND